MNKIDIIGVGLGPQDLTKAQLEIIQAADLLVGGVGCWDILKICRPGSSSSTSPFMRWSGN